MPASGTRWFHLILHTRGTWLHGDERGFRSRKHRIHSSGDYKSPPPEGEHANLHQFMVQRSNGAVVLTDDQLEPVGLKIMEKAAAAQFDLIAIAVSPTHAHLLICLPDDYDRVKRIAGQLKQASSHSMRNTLPGKIWAQGCRPYRITDERHQVATFNYIVNHKSQGAWVWCFRDDKK